MIQKVVNKIIDKQMAEGILKEGDKAVYEYGYTLLLEIVSNIAIALVLGAIMGEVKILIGMLLLLIPLRSFCGGWHASHVCTCTILSNLSILMILVMMKQEMLLDINEMIALEIFCLIIISIFAPLDSINKPLSVREKKRYKRITILILLAHFGIFQWMLAQRRESGAMLIIWVHGYVAILQLTQVLQKYKKNVSLKKVHSDK